MKQTPRELQVPRNAPQVPCSTANSLKATPVRKGRLSSQGNSEVGRTFSSEKGRLSAIKTQQPHSVFVLGVDGKPLMPTTPARAKKLLKDKVAKPVWSKFGIFGIQMLVDTRKEAVAFLGYDQGTKFEGFSIICGTENNLSIKLDLPDKNQMVSKMEERSELRRARRFRNCRRRKARFNNRKKEAGWLAPSQFVIVNSRFKILKELYRIFPIRSVCMEDVRFNHLKKQWGSNFSTMEIGKTRIKNFLKEQSLVIMCRGWQTQDFRKEFGYRKTRDKAADKFTAHCTDSLTLACLAACKRNVQPGRFIVVDDTYRFNRRKLHDTQPAKGGIRDKFSVGNVFGIKKGVLIQTSKGRLGKLCGDKYGSYRYYDLEGERQTAVKLNWFSSNFITREGKRNFAISYA